MKTNRIPDNEFSNDLEYQSSMDETWHRWQQSKYDLARKEWEYRYVVRAINLFAIMTSSFALLMKSGGKLDEEEVN